MVNIAPKTIAAESITAEPNITKRHSEVSLPLETMDGWIAPPTDLIFDDGVPLESNRHRIGINALIDSYQHHRAPTTDFYAGGNMFVYYSSNQAMNRDFRGPDFFVVMNVDGTKERKGWVAWEEGGRYPDVIVELMSPSTKKVDIGVKKELYNKIFKTTDYFVYDPFDTSEFQGWHLINGSYQELKTNDRGWLWSEKLGLWLGAWYGTIGNETTNWLRFYRPNGDLAMLPSESAIQWADSEKHRADRFAAKLKELGIDPSDL